MNLIAISLVICIASTYLGIVYGESNTYNLMDYGAGGEGKTDDSKAFVEAWKALCAADGDNPTLVVPDGTFLLMPFQIDGPCKSSNVHIQLTGNIVAPETLDAWGGCGVDTWMQFNHIENLVIDGQGSIDGRGSIWWDEKTRNGDNICHAPTALFFNYCDNLKISDVTSQNSPRNHINLKGCNIVTISNIHISAPGDSTNTDGIDLSSSTQVNIEHSTIATGDDCIAIKGGCSDINITNIACGPGHGISIGSLGQNGAHDTVEDVHVTDCTFTGTQNGARIKTCEGGSGYAKRISFDGIILEDTKNPIIIDQKYTNRLMDVYSPQSGSSAVEISDVTFNGFQGSSATKIAISLMCSDVMPCTVVNVDNVNITSAKQGEALVAECTNVDGSSTTTTPQIPCLDK